MYKLSVIILDKRRHQWQDSPSRIGWRRQRQQASRWSDELLKRGLLLEEGHSPLRRKTLSSRASRVVFLRVGDRLRTGENIED